VRDAVPTQLERPNQNNLTQPRVKTTLQRLAFYWWRLFLFQEDTSPKQP